MPVSASVSSGKRAVTPSIRTLCTPKNTADRTQRRSPWPMDRPSPPPSRSATPSPAQARDEGHREDGEGRGEGGVPRGGLSDAQGLRRVPDEQPEAELEAVPAHLRPREPPAHGRQHDRGGRQEPQRVDRGGRVRPRGDLVAQLVRPEEERGRVEERRVEPGRVGQGEGGEPPAGAPSSRARRASTAAASAT